MRCKNYVLGGALALLSAAAMTASAADWIGTWGASPLPPTPAAGPRPGTPSFANQTIRQVVRVSAGGTRVRVRFTNEYGTKPLRIGAASIALADPTGAVADGATKPLLFSGQPTALIPPGAPLLSDPVDLAVPALSNLSISLYVPEDTGPCTCHQVGMQTGFVSDSGDFTAKTFTPKQTIQSRAFVSEVDVQSPRAAKVVVVLGDSISDGVGSTLDANRRWPDLLAQRLNASKSTAAWGVVNEGISGNRILNDGAGQSALARLDRDVLSVPGVAYVIIFEGVNDLGMSWGHPTGPAADFFKSLMPPNKATTEEMTAGYRQLIARLHARGIKVLGATIAPYEGAAYYSEEGEAIRQALNTWIRTDKAFDGVLDFDAALRDPAKPTQIAAPLHAGDHLHGSDAGYQAVARSINLALFK